jgi:hypothetical protein
MENREILQSNGSRMSRKERTYALLYPVFPECDLPTQDIETYNSTYLSGVINQLRKKGAAEIETESKALAASLLRIKDDTERKARISSIIGIVLAAIAAFLIANLFVELFGAIAVAAIVCVLGYLLRNVLSDIIAVEILADQSAQLLSLAQKHKEKLASISAKLLDEAKAEKDYYFERVIEAQYKYGKNNAGIGVLADWCCEQLMQTIRQSDHRQFLDRVYAKIDLIVEYNNVVLTPTVFTQTTTLAGSKFQTKTISPSPMFVLQEHSIYNMDNDLYTIVGCAQALSSHITEKMNDVLEKNGYKSDAEYDVACNDNKVSITVNVSNPQFVPFQDM